MNRLSPLLLDVFAALDAAAVRYCLLRGYDALNTAAGTADVDLLVGAADLTRAEATLAPLGFAMLRAWGHAPHRFWIANAASGRVKLDLVTELWFGRAVRHLQVDLASRCLANRRRREPTWVPAPEDEFSALLLHALLDKRDLAAAHRARLTALWDEIGAGGGRDALLALVEECTRGGLPRAVLARALEQRDWDVLRARRAIVARALFCVAPAPAVWRAVRALAARRAATVVRRVYGGLHA